MKLLFAVFELLMLYLNNSGQVASLLSPKNLHCRLRSILQCTLHASASADGNVSIKERRDFSSHFHPTSFTTTVQYHIVEQHRLLAKCLSCYELLTDYSFQAFQSGGKVVLERWTG